MSEAFVTLVTSEPYVAGALVLGASLKRVETTKRMICMVTQGISTAQLSQFFEIINVEEIASTDHDNLKLLGRPELEKTLTKLNVWKLELDKVVFMDADMLVLNNIDNLFEYPELSAAPDVGWPDCFNSGLFVCVPSISRFNSIMEMADEGTFDGGDQGVLNSYFKDWSKKSENRIPFVYNMCFSSVYTYLPAYLQFQSEIQVVHFLGPIKPWSFQRNEKGEILNNQGLSSNQMDFIRMWWDAFSQIPHCSEKCGVKCYSNRGTDGGIITSTTSSQVDCGQTRKQVDHEFVNYRVQWNCEVEEHFRDDEPDEDSDD